MKNFKKMNQNIMLIGFMGVGKSSVSAYLSKVMGREEVELDELIVKNEGLSINEIFDQYGEEYFRRCETKTLIDLLSRERVIISCGGGVVLRDQNVLHMKTHGRIVLLNATPETIYERVKDSEQRPILNNNMNLEFITTMLEDRRQRYLEAADIIISTDYKSVEEICEELLEKLLSLE